VFIFVAIKDIYEFTGLVKSVTYLHLAIATVH